VKEEYKRAKTAITRIVIDAMKPKELPLIDLASVLCLVDGVDQVHITVSEVDARTETMKIIIVGNNIDCDELYKMLENHGCALRSTDEVVAIRS
jgi:hypothetical protein